MRRSTGIIKVVTILILTLWGLTSTVNAFPNLILPFRTGELWLVTKGYEGDGHKNADKYALDFSQTGCDPWNKPVLAVASGIVQIPSFDRNKGYGIHVLVDHGEGYVSRYAHLESISVTDGTPVAQGTEIGRVGNSGNTRGTACPKHPGTHLHFALYLNGQAAKPEPMSGYTNFTQGKWYMARNMEPSPQDHSLIRAQGGTEVFWYQHGKRYHVANPSIMEAMAGIPGWGWDKVVEYPATTVNGLSPPHPPEFITLDSRSDGILIRQQGQDPVFLMQKGQRHWITTQDAFNQMGLNDADVITVSADLIAMIKQGSGITGGEPASSTAPPSPTVCRLAILSPRSIGFWIPLKRSCCGLMSWHHRRSGLSG